MYIYYETISYHLTEDHSRKYCKYKIYMSIFTVTGSKIHACFTVGVEKLFIYDVLTVPVHSLVRENNPII